MICSWFHVHIPKRRNRRVYQTCRCGHWRWNYGYRWQPEFVERTDEEDS